MRGQTADRAARALMDLAPDRQDEITGWPGAPARGCGEMGLAGDGCDRTAVKIVQCGDGTRPWGQ